MVGILITTWVVVTSKREVATHIIVLGRAMRIPKFTGKACRLHHLVKPGQANASDVKESIEEKEQRNCA